MSSVDRVPESKLLLCRIGWMDRYDGPEGKPIYGAGSDQSDNQFESYNFARDDGKVYGYTSASINRTIRIDRLGAKKDEKSVADVTVVWFAPHQEGGQWVVGWYSKATVYRSIQPSPRQRKRCKLQNGNRVEFSVIANSQDAVLVPTKARKFPIPRGKGLTGQSSVSFLDSGLAASLDLQRELRATSPMGSVCRLRYR